jgi:hypothetical protein
MPNDLYYLQDTRQIVGNCALWWKLNGQGYTCNLDEAWKIDPNIYGAPPRDTDVFRLCSEVDALAKRHVDVQQLPKKRRALK